MTLIARSSRFEALFPGEVIGAEIHAAGRVEDLTPAESAMVVGVGVKRAQEFAAGRSCARLALAAFGIDRFDLLCAADRSPCWPSGMIGSITHTPNYCAAVVARQTHYRSLGIDAERTVEVDQEIWSQILCPEERRRVEVADDPQSMAALVFSAKEAFYKCQHPLTGEWLDFDDVVVVPLQIGLDANGIGFFEVRPLRPIRLNAFATSPLIGRYRFGEGRIYTAVGLRNDE